NRVARIARTTQHFPDFLLRRLDVQRHYVRSRPHHVARFLFVEIEYAGEHGAIGFIKSTARVRLHDQEANLFGAVPALIAGGLDSEKAEQGTRGAVEYPDEGRHEARTTDQWPRHRSPRLPGARQRN